MKEKIPSSKPIPMINQNQKREKSEKWIRQIFKDDLVASDETDSDDDIILILPHMEAGSWLLILEYYTGVKNLNTSIKGTGNGQHVKITKFLDIFSEIIDTDKISDCILNDLIEYSEENQIGYSWYFRIYLDKIRYDNFVDVRKIFSVLYQNYVSKENAGTKTDQAMMLEGILTANRRFKEFMQTEKLKESTEGENYKKAFFSL